MQKRSKGRIASGSTWTRRFDPGRVCRCDLKRSPFGESIGGSPNGTGLGADTRRQRSRLSGLDPSPHPDSLLVMPLRILFTLNAVAMAAAGIVLFVSPGLIPSLIGVDLPPHAYILSMLLGAAELGLAVLCLHARTAQEPALRRAAAWTCVAFHSASGGAELAALGQGVSASGAVERGPARRDGGAVHPLRAVACLLSLSPPLSPFWDRGRRRGRPAAPTRWSNAPLPRLPGCPSCSGSTTESGPSSTRTSASLTGAVLGGRYLSLPSSGEPLRAVATVSGCHRWYRDGSRPLGKPRSANGCSGRRAAVLAALRRVP